MMYRRVVPVCVVGAVVLYRRVSCVSDAPLMASPPALRFSLPWSSMRISSA